MTTVRTLSLVSVDSWQDSQDYELACDMEQKCMKSELKWQKKHVWRTGVAEILEDEVLEEKAWYGWHSIFTIAT